MTTYNRGPTPGTPAQLPLFLKKELEKIQRAFATISTTWAALTGKPTTIAGFGITDAYTKTEIDTTIAAINQLEARSPLVITTANLADLAVESSSKTLPFTEGELLTLEVDRECWVRFYSSEAAQLADAARDFVTVAQAGMGVLGDFKPTGASVISVSPRAGIGNDEDPLVKRVWYTIQNRSGSASTVTVTMNMVPIEP